MQNKALEGGLTDAPVEAAHIFRAALDAMARPGRIHHVAGAAPPAPLPPAAGALVLTLCDAETPVWLAPPLRTEEVQGWIRFHTGAPLAEDPGAAMFAIGAWSDLSPITQFPIGVPEYPDRSATLMVLVDELSDGAGAERLTGPGIETEARLSLPDVAAFQANRTLFPLGLDFFFCAGDRLAALPRTTVVGGL